MYVLFFLVIAVGALAFITLVDGPAEAMDDADYELRQGSTITLEGTEYEVTRIGEFTATMTYTVEEAEHSDTLESGDLVNITGTDYRVEIPDVDEPANFTLVETYPEHDLDTTEDPDGNTLVYIEEDDAWIPEEEYLEETYGPRERIELVTGDTFDFIPEEADSPITATVGDITSAGVEISWIGPAEQSVMLQRNAINNLGGVDYGTIFVGEESFQLTTDIGAFEAHLDAHEVWEERYLGFWGIGVLGVLAAVLIGGLSYLPRRR